MREVERSAASVEQAIEAALEELGISEQEADVQIVQEPQKGLLGLGSRGAVVKVRPKIAMGQSTPEQMGIATEFLRGLVEHLGVDADVVEQVVDGVQYIDLTATDDPDSMAILIGRHGQTLDALQELTRAAVQRKTAERCRLVVDVEDYRKRRRTQLVERAHEVAEKVKSSGKRQTLEPMNPFERKIVHDAVAEVGGVESVSEGEEPKRRIVIQETR